VTRLNPADERVAWLFPGQGSQHVGMGRLLFEQSAAARRLFETADAVLGRALSQICFSGPEETLRQTINAQPAIMTVSLACLAAAEERGDLTGPPAYVAGHSLGEYSAAVAAGALRFEDGLPLVQERGRLMQAAGEANPGRMAAILGLGETEVGRLCQETGAEVCNINAPEQIVIGGSPEAVEAATEQARSSGARRVVALNVSGAFHTALMEPAAQGMTVALADADIRDPQVPLIANGTGEPVETAAELRRELSFQLTHAVQWQRSLEYMVRAGVGAFVEFGPGQVLSGLVRRVVPGAKIVSVGEAEPAAQRT
jgi:[acyl-carrier-protein] S-malonyltransferase